MPLNTFEAINKRYSCRGYTDVTPPDEELKLIAEAAAVAPSAMNRQLWRIILVKEKGLLAELEAECMKNLAALPDRSAYDRVMSRGGKVYYNAPAVIFIPIERGAAAGYELIDCGIVAENIALAATALGIDNVICGLAAYSFSGDKGEEFKRRLKFPEGYSFGLSVLLGYAQEPGGKPHKPDFDKIIVIE